MTVMVHTGRWQDVLPGAYDPARAVVITDPPYGLDDGVRGYEDSIPWSEHVASVLDLLPAVRHVIRGPSTMILNRDYPQPRRMCVEIASYRRRGALRPGVVPHLWQGWLVYGRLKVERHRIPPVGDAMAVRPYVDDGLRLPASVRDRHRGLTPYSSALWIVDTWADPGMTVVDPFAGTGTIGRAASSLGFDAIGAEINPLWVMEAMMGASAPGLGL